MAFELILRDDCNSLANWVVGNTPGQDGEDRCQSPQNVSIIDGKINLRGKKALAGSCANSAFGSSSIKLKEKFAITGYGKWTYSVKCGGSRDAQGRPNAFGYDSYFGIFHFFGGWPFEIDFPEVITRDLNRCCVTQHWNKGEFSEAFQILRTDAWHTQFHTYELEIVPKVGLTFGEIIYRIDGLEVGRQILSFAVDRAVFGGGYIDGRPPVVDPDTGLTKLSWIRSPGEAPKTIPQVESSAWIDWVEVYRYVP